jgi:adenylate cyclase
MYVLFVDLCGFTAYTEEHGERAAAELAAAFTFRAMQVGRRHGLRPVKTVGDAVILVTPDVDAAANGALALLERFDATGITKVHIGLASGEVVERDGDVFGFPVNLAAHLSAEARPGQVLVDQAVARQLDGHPFEVASAGRRAMKGLSKAVELFRLLRASSFGAATS